MKQILVSLTLMVLSIGLFSQTTYTFTGNGNWTVASNWSNNAIPPSTLPAGSTINISPTNGDSCVLNTAQIILSGAGLYISTGAKFVIYGNVISGSSNFTTVTICNREWMQKNLDVRNYKNGDPIPQVTDPAIWANLQTGAWCWYNNDSATYSAAYGKLYNWYAVNDPRGLAPVGWQIPGDSDWTILTDCQGDVSIAGGKLKSTTGWNAPNTGATNSSGFAGLPGGYRSSDGTFYNTGNLGCLWSATENDPASAWYRLLSNTNTNIARLNENKSGGFSIRCIKNRAIKIATTFPSSITQVSVITGGTITDDGGLPITARGVCWSTNPNPTILNSKTNDGPGIGSFTSHIAGLLANTTYYLRAYATNSLTTIYGNETIFKTLTEINTFTDARDGQMYGFKQIGTQVWMTQNLNYAAAGSRCYDNNAANCATYGRLYNWNTALTVAPPGWHLPSDAEWTTLTTFLGTDSVAGGSMKSATGWNPPNSGANNNSGFTGLPGGYCDEDGEFSVIGLAAAWWSSTEGSTTIYARARGLNYYIADVIRFFDYKTQGFSVRCVRD